MMPVGSCVRTTILRSARSRGSRSVLATNHQSTSPRCNAAPAVAASGMIFHSIRSNHARFGPAVRDGRPIGPGHILVEPRIDHAVAGHALIGHIAVGAAADHLAHLLERVGQRQPLRHDRAQAGADLPSASGSSGNGRLRRNRMVRVVLGRQLVRRRHQRLAEPVPRAPAPDAGDAVPAPAPACRHGTRAPAAASAAMTAGPPRTRPLPASATTARTPRPGRTACRTPGTRGPGSGRPWSRTGSSTASSACGTNRSTRWSAARPIPGIASTDAPAMKPRRRMPASAIPCRPHTLAAGVWRPTPVDVRPWKMTRTAHRPRAPTACCPTTPGPRRRCATSSSAPWPTSAPTACRGSTIST